MSDEFFENWPIEPEGLEGAGTRQDRFTRPRHQRQRWTLVGVAAVAALIALIYTLVPSGGPAGKPMAAKQTTTTTKAPTTTTTVPPTTTTAPTQYLPVTVGSPTGCTAGITDGVQWIKYTVQPGDSLWHIAACFNLNGYQEIVEQNAAIIGSDPSLIHPGEVFTITLDNRQMTATP